MEPFVPKFQGRPWVSGMRVLHVYVLPRPGVDDNLLNLVETCRPILDNYPIDPQCGGEPNDAGLLHLTVEMLADAPSAEYDEEALADVVEALRSELADVSAFTTEVGPPIGNVAGAVLDVWPEADTVALIKRVRSAIRKSRGETVLQHSGGRPHISLGYSYDAASSDPLNSELRNKVTPRRATLVVDRVHLLDVAFTFDEGLGGWRMAWEPVAEIPLGR
ncbi:2'-5' RNA ligase family protein [Streptomyces sp. enrichment culture]|uniref:2'-5' RNA ligase family protein n=1 Tax=Streptomyces sp. enrichment culture TaxID=1795815 RepID=UPI003F5567E7